MNPRLVLPGQNGTDFLGTSERLMQFHRGSPVGKYHIHALARELRQRQLPSWRVRARLLLQDRCV